MNKIIKSTWRISNKLLRHRAYTVVAEKTIDLRSDTVTRPSTEMRKVMFEAEVGDDVYKEDKTINELERVTAEMFGMESALFVPSGTMGNLICLMAHCTGRGEELIIGDKQHVYVYEQAHFMQFASIGARIIPNKTDGTMKISNIEENIRTADDFHSCETKLICLENTHMSCGGIPLTNQYLNQIGQLARKHDIPVHVDGARLFNAAVATNQSLSDLLVNANSVSMCLSKGLGCPIGSMIGGSEQFIWRASRIRKALGGGMRQGGFLAAAGLYALEHGHIYIQRDHANAKMFADGINAINSPDLLHVDPNKVQTNIIFAKSIEKQANEIVKGLAERNILTTAFTDSLIRFVLHHDVTEGDVLYTINNLNDVLVKLS